MQLLWQASSISNCTQWQKFGHRINSDEEKKMLINHCTAISNLAGSKTIPWPYPSSMTLQSGLPTEAQHIVLTGIHSFNNGVGVTFSVVAVQFLAQGGEPLVKYTCVPMCFGEVLGIFHKLPKSKNTKKHIFIAGKIA